MSLEEILNQIDTVTSQVQASDIEGARNELTALNRLYQQKIPEQEGVVLPLNRMRNDGTIDATQSEAESIRDIRATYQTTILHRSIYIGAVSGFINDAESVTKSEVSEFGNSLKQKEKEVDNNMSEAESLLSGYDIPARPAITKFELPDESVPYGQQFTIEYQIKNVGDEPISNATSTVQTIGEHGETTLCDAVDVGSLDSNQTIDKTATVRSPISGEQGLRLLVEADGDVANSGELQVKAVPKQGYARDALNNLNTLKERVASAESVTGAQETTMLTTLDLAISATDDARTTAQQEERDTEEEEQARADEVNTQFRNAISSLEQFDRDFAIYRQRNDVPEETERAISNYSDTSNNLLRDGIPAGLRASGKTGTGEENPEDTPICDATSFEVEGRRIQDSRILLGGEAVRIQIHIDNVVNANEIVVTDSFPNQWQYLTGDGTVNSELSDDERTVVEFESITNDQVANNGETFTYFVESPANVEETNLYTLGPAVAYPPGQRERQREFSESIRTIVVAEDV